MDIRERFLEVMKSEGMNAKDFSLEVGISAATMSNIMNGKNNPSLDVIQKVLDRFRALSSDWLVLGVGSMYREKSKSRDDNSLLAIQPEEDDLQPRTMSSGYKATVEPKPAITNKKVAKIMIFYTDGSFDEIQAQQ